MNVQLTSNIAEFNQALAKYVTLTSKTPADALAHKVRDLNIKVWQGFRLHSWGGPNRQPGIAAAELIARREAGKGTKVRPKLLEEYRLQRSLLGLEFQSALKGVKGAQARKYLSAGFGALSVNLWQSFVGKEIKRRQSGIGVLATSFLMFRKRSNQERGVFYVLNKTKRPMGRLVIDEDSALIESTAPGVTTVDTRYGVVAQAIARATADMKVYLEKKDADNKREAGLA